MDFLLLEKRAAMGVAAVLLAMSLAACGGDDGGGEGDAAAAAPSTSTTSPPKTDPTPITDFPPVISGTPITQVAVGSVYSFTPTAVDANGDTLTFSAVNLPSWATFDSATGAVGGTPQAQHVGTFNLVTISVTANGKTASLPPYDIEVVSPPVTDSPPVISGSPATQVVAGSAYSFTPTASDPDDDDLSFSIVNQPTWAAFDKSTGTLSGTPQAQHVGNYNDVTISVTANGKTASLEPYDIQVASLPVVDAPPVISGTPPTQVVAGSLYAFTPTASDPDGDALSFTISNKPSWANFDSVTGSLTGTPQTQHVGNFTGIRIRVTANGKTASLPLFSIQVTSPPPPDAPPVISGTPPKEVVVGSAYSFTPTASDPNDDELSFSIANKPTWANFDPATGSLTGTPQAQHIGTYSGVTISVTANGKKTSLAAFSIEVLGMSPKSVTLTWLPPTENEDGSALTDLAGYKIRYGQSSGNYTKTVTVADPGVSSWQIDNLVSGTYYFVISAYNSSGVESSYSNEASKAL